MYRTQTIPGGILTLIGILALSFLMPGWVASGVGLAAPHAHLIGWILRQQGLAWLFLLLLYGVTGFAILLGAAVTVYATGVVLIRGLAEVKNWALRASLAMAKLLGEALYWPVQLLIELLQDEFERFGQIVAEQRELRRIYREEYANDFPTYRAFARHWRALSDGGPASKPDPYEQAVRLMGLPPDFTRDDLKQRFRILIERIHPDKVGPNELATQLIDAYTLINQRKGWR